MNNLPVNVFNNDYVQSNVNPIKREVEYKNIHFNSKFRKNYYNTSSTNFHYELPEPCSNVVSMKLSAICVPTSFYLFSEEKGNNRFIIEDISGGIVQDQYVIIIPDGNYSASELVEYLNDNYFHSSGTTTFLQYIYFSINPYSGKTTFDISGALGGGLPGGGLWHNQISLKFVNNKKTCNIMDTAGWILGFRYGQYTNIFGTGTLGGVDVSRNSTGFSSEGIFNQGENCDFFFCLDDFNKNVNNSNIVFFQDSTMRNDVLAKLKIVNGSFSIDVNNQLDDEYNHTKTRKYFGPVDIRKIHVRILDQYGNQVNLNNMDFSFSLELTQLYNNI